MTPGVISQRKLPPGSFYRSPGIAFGDVEPISDSLRPVDLTHGSATRDRFLNLLKLRLALRSIYDLQPIKRLRYRPCRQRQIIAKIATSPETAPTPVLRALHEHGAQRVSFDVSKKRQQVCLGLNWDGAVAILVNRACSERPMRRMPAFCVRASQPMHEIR